MKLVMTLMVRDEADIISAMVEHHFAQGIDSMIVTDNGSVDGTTELLHALAKTHSIELRFDPVHRKQQHDVVTEMARAAFTTHSADWVINADADEFFIPMDRSMTLRGVFERLPKSLVSFNALVTNLVGPPARSGTGLQRLVYRDERSDSTLQEHGIVARPTPNAIHIGDPNVTVAQGNHFVNLASAGSPVPALAVEVLHLPWRSWEQFAHKVEIAGLAYESNPDLSPSPNHHGMLDYGRFKSGMLMPYYLLRHPTEEALSAGLAHGEYVHEDVLSQSLASPVLDVPLSKEDASFDADVFDYVRSVETKNRNLMAEASAAAKVRESAQRRRILELESENVALEEELNRYKERRVVRTIDRVVRPFRRR